MESVISLIVDVTQLLVFIISGSCIVIASISRKFRKWAENFLYEILDKYFKDRKIDDYKNKNNKKKKHNKRKSKKRKKRK